MRQTNNNISTTNCFALTQTNGRTSNQDSFLVQSFANDKGECLVLLAVADGMGGHPHGGNYSENALEALGVALYRSVSLLPCLPRHQSNDATSESAWPHPAIAASENPDALGAALVQAVHQANSELVALKAERGWKEGGTTIVATLIQEGVAWVANLGDSPLFHFSSDSKSLVQVTELHNVANTLMRSGLLTPEMAKVHEGRSQLQLYVGMQDLPVQVPLHKIEVKTGDRLVLTSDGGCGDLSLLHIASIVGEQGTPLDALAHLLLKHCRLRGETDNQTVVIWEY